jgi:probable O-glycosylation ligase (exosortase A-associated)
VSLRDVFLTMVVFGSLPVILYRADIGILMWCWLSYMNPQRFTWGFAWGFSFAEAVAIATLLGLILSREPKKLPVTAMTVLLVLLGFWTSVTTVFAYDTTDALWQWEQFMKMLIMTFAAVALMHSRERINAMVWAIAVSIGFFGIKGGIFTILTGGAFRVWGPPGTFFSDNNQLALTLIMVVPLMRYLQLQTRRYWVWWGLAGAMALSMLSALGSYSRGAFLALGVMALFMALKSRKKLLFSILVVAGLAGSLAFMPGQWDERMDTIREYKTDTSVQGRFNAWTFAYNLAKDHPFVGGGFGAFTGDLFARYAPDPTGVHSAHSIYFQVLGSHGFVGLALFLLLGAASLFAGGSIIRRARGHPELSWCRDLGAMLQVSLIGYAVGGAFLNLAFFDLFYHLVALLILAQAQVRNTLREARRAADEKAAPPAAPRLETQPALARPQVAAGASRRIAR